MAWRKFNNVVEQTGNDQNLQGLSAIAGIDVVSDGTEDNYSVYSLNNLTIQVKGRLIIPLNENLLIGATTQNFIEVMAGGTLVFADCKVEDNGIMCNQGLGLVTLGKTDSAAGAAGTANTTIIVRRGGAFNMHGGLINTNKNFVFEEGSKIFITKANINMNERYSTYPFMVRCFTDDIKIDNLTFSNGGSLLLAKQSKKSVAGLEFINAWGIQASGYQAKDVTYTIRDYKSIISESDAPLWQNLRFDFINVWNGSDIKILGTSSNDAKNTGCVAIFSEVEFNILNKSGAKIPDCKVHVHDENSGNRKNFDFGHANVNEDFTVDRKNFGTADAQGDFQIMKILLGVVVRSVGGARGTADTGENKIDLRSKAGKRDVFGAHILHYNYLSAEEEIHLEGTGVKHVDKTLIEDELITEKDMTVVAAYGTAETAERAYDAAKLFLHNNFDTIDNEELILKRTGKNIMCEQNVAIDQNSGHGEVVHWDGADLVTIKAKEFAGNIILPNDKEVTFLNGSGMDKSYVFLDKTGDSYFVIDLKSFNIDEGKYTTGISKHKDHPRLSTDNTTKIFKFSIIKYPIGSIFTLRYAIGHLQITKWIEVKNKGRNVVSFDTNEAIEELQVGLEGIRSEIASVTNTGLPDIKKDTQEIIRKQDLTHDVVINKHHVIYKKFALIEKEKNDHKWFAVPDGSHEYLCDCFVFDSGNKITINVNIDDDKKIGSFIVSDLIFTKEDTALNNFKITAYLVKTDDTAVIIGSETDGARTARGQGDENPLKNWRMSISTSNLKKQDGYKYLRLEIEWSAKTGNPELEINNVEVYESYDADEVTDSLQTVRVNDKQISVLKDKIETENKKVGNVVLNLNKKSGG